MTMELDIRAIAFYLPQFHPIAENDEWWGKGFTEWRNVTAARPHFPGHYQPHLPADLGFYDLRLPEAREAQAELARQYGIHGFCYYHYWFNGRRLLERPFQEVLQSGQPSLPFCLCWANENWTRIWDGGSKHLLMEQRYDADDDVAHIRSLVPAFSDPRYIRIDGRPVFLVYRTGILPDPAATAERWRKAVRAAGIDDLYLVRVESHSDAVDPTSIGFDASVEFAPFNGMRQQMFSGRVHRLLTKLGLRPRATTENRYYDYRDVVQQSLARPEPAFTRFSCVSPGWDNSARRQRDATILLDSKPEFYEHWLREAAARTRKRLSEGQRLCFINAWNEWAEGNHLEPDRKWQSAYLEATARALSPGSAT